MINEREKEGEMEERERERERPGTRKKKRKREGGYFVERRNTQQSWLFAALKLLMSLSLSILLVLPSSPAYNTGK